MLLRRDFWAVLAAAVVLGCSKGTRVAPGKSPLDDAKAVLEEVAKTGEPTSGLDDVRSYLETLKESDPAKAEPLLKDVNDMMGGRAAKKEQVKAKAKEILGKL